MFVVSVHKQDLKFCINISIPLKGHACFDDDDDDDDSGVGGGGSFISIYVCSANLVEHP